MPGLRSTYHIQHYIVPDCRHCIWSTGPQVIKKKNGNGWFNHRDYRTYLTYSANHFDYCNPCKLDPYTFHLTGTDLIWQSFNYQNSYGQNVACKTESWTPWIHYFIFAGYSSEVIFSLLSWIRFGLESPGTFDCSSRQLFERDNRWTRVAAGRLSLSFFIHIILYIDSVLMALSLPVIKIPIIEINIINYL